MHALRNACLPFVIPGTERKNSVPGVNNEFTNSFSGQNPEENFPLQITGAPASFDAYSPMPVLTGAASDLALVPLATQAAQEPGVGEYPLSQANLFMNACAETNFQLNPLDLQAIYGG